MDLDRIYICIQVAAAIIVIATAAYGIFKLLVHAYIRRHTLPVTREKAKEIRLDQYLEDQDMALVWRHAATVDQDVQHDGYERIKWKDPCSGKVWRLVGDLREDYPLAKKRS